MADGLRRGDIRPCAACKRGLAKGGPMVYRVRVETFVLDPQAIQQAHGLDLMIGPGLASVMGPDPELAKRLNDNQVLVCLECMSKLPALVLADKEQQA